MAIALRLPALMPAAPPAAPPSRERMADEVRRGLLAPRPWLPSKYFYDDRGSELFERITRLDEYYQTRTEEQLLADVADRVIAAARPRELVELGSGAGRKIRTLLDAQRRAGLPLDLTFFDINARFVAESARRLAADYPDLSVRGVVGDFTEDLTALGRGGGRLALFLGGTIGNLHPEEVPGFLRRMADRLAPGDALLIGVDQVKPRAILEAAYNDAQGVTAAFNLNVLAHLNVELDADFDLARFEHVAFWDAEHRWIEMRLRATAPSRVRIAEAWLDLRFAPGDEIRTEISCKYTRGSFAALVGGTGFALETWYADAGRLFALAFLRRIA